MKEVYLYFRTQATIGDDDSSADSMCFPLSHFCGFVPTADDTLNIYFKPVIMKEKVQFDHDGDSTTSVKNDYVVVTLSSVNTHKDVITRLSRLFAGAANGGGPAVINSGNTTVSGSGGGGSQVHARLPSDDVNVLIAASHAQDTSFL